MCVSVSLLMAPTSGCEKCSSATLSSVLTSEFWSIEIESNGSVHDSLDVVQLVEGCFITVREKIHGKRSSSGGS